MVGLIIRVSLRLLALSCLIYLLFFVPLGERTLYEHFARIARTPEAQDLGHEVDGVMQSATRKARDHVVAPATRLVEHD